MGYLIEEFGLTKEDAFDWLGKPFYWGCVYGHLNVVKYLKEEFQLTKKDVKDEILVRCYQRGNGHILTYLKNGFGFTRQEAYRIQYWHNRNTVNDSWNPKVDLLKYF